MSFRIDRESLGGRSAVIRLGGGMDLYAAPEFKRLMMETVTAGNADVVCDLSDVTFIDSTALGVMVQGRKRLERRGGSLHLVCRDPAIRQVFEIVGLDRMLPIHTTLSDALAAVRRPKGGRGRWRARQRSSEA